MPGRYVREGILTSPAVNRLTPHAELFYRRLLNVVDDYGRFYSGPTLLRAACFPLQVDRIREADVSRWLSESVTAGLILLYTFDGTGYLVVAKTETPRAAKSKFPEPPPDCKTVAKRLQNEPITNAPIPITITNTKEPPYPPAGGAGVSEIVSESAESAETPDPDGFLRFWKAFPRHERKVGRPKCLREWRRRKLEPVAENVVAALESAKASAGWRKQGGAFIPMPLTWLNQSPWETPAEERAPSANGEAAATLDSPRIHDI